MIALHLATFGLFIPYWHYRQWKAVSLKSGEQLWPIPRALFAPLFGWDLYPRMHKAACAEGVPVAWPSWTLPLAAFLLNAIGWTLTVLDVNAFPLAFLWLLDIIPPLMAQRTLRSLHDKVAPEAGRNTRITVWNALWLLLGGVLWFGTLLQFVPKDPVP